MLLCYRYTVCLLSLAAASLCFSTHVVASIQNGLQAYYQFDGDGLDSSGNGRNLNLEGGIGFGAGLFGQALNPGGNNSQFAQRPVSDSIFNFGSSDFTIQTWVNFASLVGEQTIIEKFSGQLGPGWTLTKLDFNNGSEGLRFAFSSGGTAFNVDSGPLGSLALQLGEWHNITIRRVGDDFNLFLDSAGIANLNNVAGAIEDTTMPLLVGRRNAGDGRDFSLDGLIDETAIWSRALTNEEIASQYNMGNGQVIVPEPYSLAVWGLLVVTAAKARRRRGL